jgi:hypothetical protein
MWKTWKSAFFVAAFAKQAEETSPGKVDFLWGKGRFLHIAATGRQTAAKQEAAPSNSRPANSMHRIRTGSACQTSIYYLFAVRA